MGIATLHARLVRAGLIPYLRHRTSAGCAGGLRPGPLRLHAAEYGWGGVRREAAPFPRLTSQGRGIHGARWGVEAPRHGQKGTDGPGPSNPSAQEAAGPGSLRPNTAPIRIWQEVPGGPLGRLTPPARRGRCPAPRPRPAPAPAPAASRSTAAPAAPNPCRGRAHRGTRGRWRTRFASSAASGPSGFRPGSKGTSLRRRGGGGPSRA
jgi:hypothetical protein